LLIVGDRFETIAAALAATLVGVPIAHMHGGEETEGAIDNAFRHATTKLAHLHFVSEGIYARRVRALGEDTASIHVVGAAASDNFERELPGCAELERLLGIEFKGPLVVVTVHPTTLASNPTADARAVADAMTNVSATYVITLPNTDPGNEEVRAILQTALRGSRGVAVDALGERNYLGLLHCAQAMLGNSSSGLIEAPMLNLPVVNVGDRQRGRLRFPNIVDAAADSDAVAASLNRVLDPSFRAGLPPPRARPERVGARIAEILATTVLERPLRKASIRVGGSK
jgi:UDP-hydrolysing UDP-N-acetyl-D-glucosamine 2-epimerase